MFDDLTRNEIADAAKGLDIELAALLAVAEVESGGSAFALVEGRREPLIRFEGHYFDRRLTGA
ncbi:MAG: N-acetylmuramidase domain-containing protein, partial [Mesorhizobium sp.]